MASPVYRIELNIYALYTNKDTVISQAKQD